MGNGISSPTFFFSKRQKLNVKDYIPLKKEAPSIRTKKSFEWSTKNEIMNQLRSPRNGIN